MIVFSIILLVSAVLGFQPLQDDDLVTYKTLPQYRALKWNITYYDRSTVAPGYWFVAPYFINEGEPKSNRWIPCQIGAHIFDQNGELVWAGSCEFDNRNIYDFRMVDTMDEKPYLAMLLPREVENQTSHVSAIIYDNQYKPVHIIPSPAEDLDTHEINIRGPSEALAMIYRPEMRDMSTFGQPERSMMVTMGGFVEFDPTTGQALREWRSGDHIALDESDIFHPDIPDTNPDYIHVNSIDKNQDGDYLLSCRHSDTIYFISGLDGHIVWRLGGKKNNFAKDFEFSRQHDARFIAVDGPRMILSFLNNGAGDHVTNEPTSSAMYVELDTIAMTARLLKRYMRPDGGSTNKRGNMQTLPNSNILVSWSMNGYMSEFTHDGRLLMEASFASERYSTYRAYKFPWWSRPSYPPTLVASCYGVNGSGLSTVFHVGWNGATGVRHWRFYARANATSPDQAIGTISKNGFETSYIARGYMDMVSVEALDADYAVLGRSAVIHTAPPEYWPKEVEMPMPDDPEVIANLSHTPLAPTQVKRPFGKIFLIGCVISAAGCLLLQFLYPRFRRYARWTYSRVHMDDPELSN